MKHLALTLLAACVGTAILAAAPSRAQAADAPVPAAARGDASSLRVMSFNIRYGTAADGANHWDKRKDFLMETIQRFDPDLLGTQETLEFQRVFLATGLPGHEDLGVGREDGVKKGEMAALFYRRSRFEKLEGGHFWLSTTPETAGSKSWDSSLPRMVTWVKLRETQRKEAPALLFLNTHFDHLGAQARLESAKLLRQRLTTLGAGCRVVVTGDFNAGETSDPYRALFGETAGAPSPIYDTYRAAYPTPVGDESTSNDFTPKVKGRARIDWIGASRGWKTLSAAIDRVAREGRTPSDHFPVTAVLAWP
jgi:endonuclease/exonuclease/phosphatase family metal-dependent hydrolase